MRRHMRVWRFTVAVLALGCLASRAAGAWGGAGGPADAPPVAVVCNVSVTSDKVPDLSSLEAWRRAFIRPGMTDAEKALAVWKSNVMFVFQDPPPVEHLSSDGCVHDPIKSFNVYGYGMCCCAAARVECLARCLGLPARGWGLNGHSLPEVFYDGEWHMLDASLVNYFPRPDGKPASIAEIAQAVQAWLAQHPALKGNDAKLRAFQQADGWTGWKKGPALISASPFLDAGGWWPARTHGWYATMQEFDGTKNTPFPYEYGYSQGYRVNIRLRPGERLTRNWSNKGLHVNGLTKAGNAPGCLKADAAESRQSMAFLKKDYGDLAPGRVGSGTLTYDVPLADPAFRAGVLRAENIAWPAGAEAAPAVGVGEAGKQGVLEIDMPTSYVYLTGRLGLDAAVGPGGRLGAYLSLNNGLDWREVATLTASGRRELDMGRLVLGRYDYRLRLVLSGAGTAVRALSFRHDVQCSQRALPILDRGENTIRFAAGPRESTVTIEGVSAADAKGKPWSALAFAPALDGVSEEHFVAARDGATITFPIATPTDMTCLRFGGHMRVRDQRDQWDMQVSFDGARTFKTVATQTGPFQGICKYVTVSDVPPGTRSAHVRWSGKVRNTTCLFALRIDADHTPPAAGFRPVRITYAWEEGGLDKTDVHVAKTPEDTYKITCATKPAMKSITLELAKSTTASERRRLQPGRAKEL